MDVHQSAAKGEGPPEGSWLSESGPPPPRSLLALLTLRLPLPNFIYLNYLDSLPNLVHFLDRNDVHDGPSYAHTATQHGLLLGQRTFSIFQIKHL